MKDDEMMTAAREEGKEERPSPAFYIIGSLIILYVLTQMVSCEMYWLEVGKSR